MIILLKNIGNEFRPLSKIAGPLIVNNLSIAGMQFADTIMSGMLGAESLAAVAVGSQIWFLGFMVSLGLMTAISPIVARHYGAGDFGKSGSIPNRVCGLPFHSAYLYFYWLNSSSSLS